MGQCLDGSVILSLEIRHSSVQPARGVNPEFLDGLPMKPRLLTPCCNGLLYFNVPGAGMDVQQRSAVTHLALNVVMSQAALHGYRMIDFQRA